MPVIRFVREGRDVECYPGENLREVARREGIELYGLKGQLGNCGGCGQCITCFVSVVDEDNADALTTASAVAQLPLQAIELNALTPGHLTQILTGVTLHITPFANKPDNGHELTSNQPPSWAEALRFVNSRGLTFMSLTVAGRSLFPRPMD